MRAKLLAVPLLIGAGFLVSVCASSRIVHAGQQGKGGGKAPVNRPAPRPNNLSKAQTPPAPQRPAPRPSTPTLSRPSAPAQPKQQPWPQQPSNRPSIGVKPPTGNPTPQARPTTPRPVQPTTRPTLPTAPKIDRPTTLPGLGGSISNRPKVDPTPPVVRPPINSNQRPSVQPGRPDQPAKRPGLPTIPTDRPGNKLPPIGERPNLPNRPERPPINWPNKPDLTRPTPLPEPIPKDNKPKLPDPKGKLPDPKGKPPDRPGVVWPNRPPPGRPSGNVNINRPTVVNRPTQNTTIINNRVVNNNRTVVNNINQQTNYYSNTTNVYPGSNVWSVRLINDYHGAWYNNFSYWHQSYHSWYNGPWHGNAFDHWGLGIANVGVGFGLWGLNSLNYIFGYTSYVNPFYVAPPPTVVVPQYLTYTQPVINVVQALPETGREPPPLPPSSAELFDAALAEFKKGNSRAALDKTEQAMKQFPDDPVMHEFRALCLFALGEYRQASAALHALLASGPGWDWTTLSSLYPDIDTYSGQLSALEKRAATNPDDTAALFLLAYHYTTIGQADAAREVLNRLHKLLPTDSVVTQLWQAAGGTVATSTTPPKQPPPPPDINLDIVGNWVATRPDGGRIGLGVKNDGTFTWSIEDKTGKKDAFDGTFTLEDNLLILERTAGGALMGRVTALSDTSFNFKAIGGGDADPGLVFKK